MLKRCSKCGIEKDISEFYRRSASKDGYECLCKKCRSKRQKAYHQTPKGKRVNARAQKKYLKTENGKIIKARSDEKYNQTKKVKWPQEEKIINGEFI